MNEDQITGSRANGLRQSQSGIGIYRVRRRTDKLNGLGIQTDAKKQHPYENHGSKTLGNHTAGVIALAIISKESGEVGFEHKILVSTFQTAKYLFPSSFSLKLL